MVASTDEEYGTDDAAIPVASDVIRSTILRFALPLEIPGDKPCAEALLTPVRASDAPPQLVKRPGPREFDPYRRPAGQGRIRPTVLLRT